MIGQEKHNISAHEYLKNLRKNSELVHEIAGEHLKASTQYQKRNYETNVKVSFLSPGKFAFLFSGYIKKGLARKFIPKWKGPYLNLEKLEMLSTESN